MVLIFDSSTFFILKKILENCTHYNKLILSTHFAPPLFSYPLKTSKTFRMFSWGKKKTRSMKWVSLTIIQKYVGYLSSVSHNSNICGVSFLSQPKTDWLWIVEWSLLYSNFWQWKTLHIWSPVRKCGVFFRTVILGTKFSHKNQDNLWVGWYDTIKEVLLARGRSTLQEEERHHWDQN